MSGGWIIAIAILLPPLLLWMVLLPALHRIERSLPPTVTTEPWDNER